MKEASWFTRRSKVIALVSAFFGLGSFVVLVNGYSAHPERHLVVVLVCGGICMAAHFRGRGNTD